MDILSRRRHAIHYIFPESESGTDDEAEVEVEDEFYEPIRPDSGGCCHKCKIGFLKFLHSMAISDEDEVLFIHGSWEIMDNGIGKFSAVMDYLVYRSFYALFLLGLTIYAVALNVNHLEHYPIVHFMTAVLHILYSVLYTLHIVAGKTQMSQVKKEENEKADVEEHIVVRTPRESLSTRSSRTSDHRRTDLALIDIGYAVRNKPHPIQTTDKVVWFLFNCFAAPTVASTAIYYSGYVTKTNDLHGKSSFVLTFVYVDYTCFATILELGLNCIPMRLAHFIYPLGVITVYGFLTYIIEVTGNQPAFEQQNWINEPLNTALSYVVVCLVTLAAHFLICALGWARSYMAYIMSTQRKIRKVGREKHKNLESFVESEKTLRASVESPNFSQEFMTEDERKERAERNRRLRIQIIKRFLKGIRESKRREKLHIQKAKADNSKAKIARRSISGIKRKVTPKKWNEFHTPPDSYTDLALQSRRERLGTLQKISNHDQVIEEINRKLSEARPPHHVNSNTSKNRLTSDAKDANELQKRAKSLLALLKPQKKISLPIVKNKSSSTPETEPKRATSLTGVEVQDNSVPLAPDPGIVPPKSNWYLRERFSKPLESRPLPEAEIKRKKSQELNVKALLEQEKKRKLEEIEDKHQGKAQAEEKVAKKDARKQWIIPPPNFRQALAYRPSKSIKKVSATLKAREDARKAKEEEDRVAFMKKDEEEQRERMTQEERSRKSATEQMKKPRKGENRPDVSDPDNHIIFFLTTIRDETAKISALAKSKDKGILKGPQDSVSTRESLLELVTSDERPKTVAGLRNRSQRSNLQFQARAQALGPMVGSAYHPLKPPAVPARTGDNLTFYYLDAKLEPQNIIEAKDLENYQYHPGTHVHHPLFNLRHPQGPHMSLTTAIKEHVSTKLENFRKNRRVHPVLKPVRRQNQSTELPKKDAPVENPFRVIAYHPIVQFMTYKDAKVKENDKDKAEDEEPPQLWTSPPPNPREIYPRAIIELIKAQEEATAADNAKSDLVRTKTPGRALWVLKPGTSQPERK